jgi:hypothetical protein
VSLAAVDANGLVTAKAATDTAGPTSASSTLADVEVLGALGLSPASLPMWQACPLLGPGRRTRWLAAAFSRRC